jgi:hypothetical protein
MSQLQIKNSWNIPLSLGGAENSEEAEHKAMGDRGSPY